MRTYLFAALLAGGVVAGTSNYKHLMLLSDDSVPTYSYADADGEFGVEGDVELQGSLYLGTNGVNIVADTDNEIQFGDSEDISLGFGTSNYVLLSSDTGVTRIEPGAIEILDSMSYSITFNAGAGLGMAMLQSDGTAYDTTADVLNHVYYKEHRLNFTTSTIAAGTFTPAMEAAGLDITIGGADNDALQMWGATLGASGRPLVAGTDAASFCVSIKVHDETGCDEMYIGWRTASNIADDPITNNTDYCAIGNVSGDIKVNDKTTGATDTTDNWAADETHTLCTLVSAARACTYTIDAAAPTATDAHSLTSGLLFVPFLTLREATGLCDETHVVSWVVSKSN